MSAVFDSSLCLGCGECALVCPGGLIDMGEGGLARIREPERCWDCASCVKECPARAVCLMIHKELGGLGAKLTARLASGPELSGGQSGGQALKHAGKPSVVLWEVVFPDGGSAAIEMDPFRREG